MSYFLSERSERSLLVVFCAIKLFRARRMNVNLIIEVKAYVHIHMYMSICNRRDALMSAALAPWVLASILCFQVRYLIHKSFIITSLCWLQTALCRLSGHSTCERHTVRTADGFLLTAVRIAPLARRPGRAPGRGDVNAVPVLIMPGNFASSDSWLMRRDGSNIGKR